MRKQKMDMETEYLLATVIGRGGDNYRLTDLEEETKEDDMAPLKSTYERLRSLLDGPKHKDAPA